jgi:hypothetical protein
LKMNRVVVDRFEGDFAVVELPDRTMIDVPKALFPDETIEGDIIEIRIDKDEAKNQEAQIKGLMDELWE